MKKTFWLVLLIATTAWAQQGEFAELANTPTPPGSLPSTGGFPVQRVQMPTYADIYCCLLYTSRRLARTVRPQQREDGTTPHRRAVVLKYPMPRPVGLSLIHIL